MAGLSPRLSGSRSSVCSVDFARLFNVMPDLVPGIHVGRQRGGPTWMAGTGPAMTTKEFIHVM